MVDIAREQMPNSGGIPDRVSNVPVAYMNDSQFWIFVNCHSNCPFYSGFNSNNKGEFTNKDGGGIFLYCTIL